MPRGLNLH